MRPNFWRYPFVFFGITLLSFALFNGLPLSTASYPPDRALINGDVVIYNDEVINEGQLINFLADVEHGNETTIRINYYTLFLDYPVVYGLKLSNAEVMFFDGFRWIDFDYFEVKQEEGHFVLILHGMKEADRLSLQEGAGGLKILGNEVRILIPMDLNQ